jgi:rhodanese-related sulfurtransferase
MNTIDAKTLKQWQADHRSFLLLDVLNADSFAKDHIPGSVNVRSMRRTSPSRSSGSRATRPAPS